MESQELVKSIASEVKKELLEGGAGSGNWGHKGRPGHRGGSLGGGRPAKRSGEMVSVRREVIAIRKAGGKISYKKALAARTGGGGKGGGVSAQKVGLLGGGAVTAKVRTGGGGISAHIVKPGVHASTFYDKSGGLKTSMYRKLKDSQKMSVLRHGVQKYKEQYVPKAKQGGMSAAGIGANKKVGALEGMRRAAINKAKGSSGKEGRAALHIAISLQQRVAQVAGSHTKSGSKEKHFISLGKGSVGSVRMG